jgi:hypothetical protein
MTIKFHKQDHPYGCFSNFSHHGFELDGRYWLTSEHYFQAQKFAGTKFEEEIRLIDNPGKAAIRGKDRMLPLRRDWEQVKDDIMRKAILKKIETHNEVKLTLLNTSDEELIENSRTDYYWGCGADGNGKNMLGKILMEIRTQLRNEIGNV